MYHGDQEVIPNLFRDPSCNVNAGQVGDKQGIYNARCLPS